MTKTPTNAYRRLNFPVLILRGERTLMPTPPDCGRSVGSAYHALG